MLRQFIAQRRGPVGGEFGHQLLGQGRGAIGLLVLAVRLLLALGLRLVLGSDKPALHPHRTVMRERVFNHPPARKQLEAIMHGRIQDAVMAALEAATEPYVLLVVPLLIEVGSYRPILSRVLVVDCEEENQIKRASIRAGMTPTAVRAIMAAQTDRKTRLRVADDVIENNADLASLETVVRQLDRQYRTMASV